MSRLKYNLHNNRDVYGSRLRSGINEGENYVWPMYFNRETQRGSHLWRSVYGLGSHYRKLSKKEKFDKKMRRLFMKNNGLESINPLSDAKESFQKIS